MNTSRILLIRHGQSAFNAAYEETGRDPLLFDARLTAKGEAQVLAARELLKDEDFDLVVASPLTRALQTAFGIFEGHRSNPHFAIEALHREHLESSCDVGRSPSLLLAEFPTLEFGHLSETWWHVEGEPHEFGWHIEPPESLSERIALFRAFLAARPEQRIAVVGHGTFFYHLTGSFLPNCGMIELDLDAR
ncbi:histidine phosphatase family protein [Acidisoma cellulosilytica]|uniref:Histidine phosphatase family protein n=1 Tax=Acidisoma cellulosilyticum TaxID=2802395 RepID=A0A963Z3M5_9PROT|nr:histidine phosphatase family protein [Acidisoma cellulosilyticum]MCB8882280.1 histidine phosphatase family protein [Acidisoma cellulosilyticum]